MGRPARDGVGTDSAQIEAGGISKSFGGTRALSDVDLRVLPGQVTAVVGPNGAGKSVLGRVRSGLDREDSGEVLLRGRRVGPARRRRRVWYIGQDLDSQLFGQSVLDELTTGLPRSPEVQQRAVAVLRELGLEEFSQRHPATLSGGQKQRLLLGVALMHEASVLILDEPTSGLDGRTMTTVSAVFRELADRGHAIVLITHDVECALACCDRVVRLDGGTVTLDAAVDSPAVLLRAMGRDG